MRNLSTESSRSEFVAFRFCSLCTNSAATPPSESVNLTTKSDKSQNTKENEHTESIALLSGELDFSETIVEIDSTEENARE